MLETVRPYEISAESRRLRVTWEGAEYRGRGRQTNWDGEARVEGNHIEAAQSFNFWNPDRPLNRDGDRLHWLALTTGNFGGFDVYLSDPRAGRIKVDTPHAKLDLPIAEIGAEPVVRDAGGLARRLSIRRLPERMSARAARFERRLPVAESGDSPFWISVYQEDGYQAWSSPIYVIP